MLRAPGATTPDANCPLDRRGAFDLVGAKGVATTITMSSAVCLCWRQASA
jgi:hypothetical protein